MPDYSDLGFVPDSGNEDDDLGFVPDLPAPKSAPTWADKLGILTDYNRTPADLAEGIASGAASTIFHGGDLIRRGQNWLADKTGLDFLHAKRIINTPEVQKILTPPPGPAGTIGKTGEQIAEYLIPSGWVGKGVKAVEATTAGMKLAPRIARVAPKLAPYLEPALNLTGRAALEGASAAGVTAAQTGDLDEAARAGKIGAAMPVGAAVVKKVGAPVVRGLSDLYGTMTGTGGETIRRAATTATKDFVQAMRDPQAESRIVTTLDSAASNLQAKRAADYTARLSQLDQSILGDPKPIRDELTRQLQSFKAPLGDFRSSPVVNPGDRKLMQKAITDVARWADWTPSGMDTLKQRITSYGTDASPKTQAFFWRVKDSIKGQLEHNVPGYAEMTSEYEKASEFLRDIRNELSTGQGKNPGTTIRKLSNSLNQNNEYRKMLLEMIDEKAGTNLVDQIAGNSMRSWRPRGLAGVGAGLGTAWGLYAHNPAGLAGLALSSPRVAGELLSLLNVLSRKVPTGAGTMGATGAVMRATLPPELVAPPR